MVLTAGFAVLAALIAALAVDGPVSRHRVQQFADRHRIAVTPDNGALIVAYLATTRRWRAGGLAGGLAAHAALDLRHVSLTYVLAGWFAGALVAEVRVAGLLGPRRVASLTPRTPQRYLSRLGRRALPASVAASLILTGVAAANGGEVIAPVAITVVVGLVVWLTARRILERPQSVAPADVLAADNAIRSRSLHAVTASGVTLVLYCAFGRLLWIIGDGPSTLVVAVLLAGAVAVPWFGRRLATSPWTVSA